MLMPIDIAISAAVAALAPYLADAAKGAAEGVGEGAAHAAGRLLGWLRQKLTGRAKAALDDLEAEPQLETNQQILSLRLAELAAKQPIFLEELRRLLPAGAETEVRQRMTLGTGAKGAQTVGQGNTTIIG
jgi:hypothetical protein